MDKSAPIHVSIPPEEAEALEIIGRTDFPVGSRQITHELRGRGFTLSESTVSRLLRKLDSREMTRCVGSKGRLLTKAGCRQLEELQVMARRQSRDYLDVQSIQDLLNLLLARRAIEPDGARAAASRISKVDLEHLQELIASQSAAIPDSNVTRGVAREFHRTIARASENKLLGAMADLALDPGLDRTESVLDVIVGSHHNESQSIKEHREIVDALAAGDPQRAEQAMFRHVNRLIEEVEAFLKSDNVAFIDRLFTWMRSEVEDK